MCPPRYSLTVDKCYGDSGALTALQEFLCPHIQCFIWAWLPPFDDITILALILPKSSHNLIYIYHMVEFWNYVLSYSVNVTLYWGIGMPIATTVFQTLLPPYSWAVRSISNLRLMIIKFVNGYSHSQCFARKTEQIIAPYRWCSI